ncbi:MAG: UPF0758 domain-containing protein [Longimicrobiales bacterium]
MLQHDCPRERLCRFGPAALSDADLLIGSGTAHLSGPVIAAKLLVRVEAPGRRRLGSRICRWGGPCYLDPARCDVRAGTTRSDARTSTRCADPWAVRRFQDRGSASA